MVRVLVRAAVAVALMAVGAVAAVTAGLVYILGAAESAGAKERP